MMALLNCPDCGSEVSDQAVACPKCARPMAAGVRPAVVKKKSNATKIIGALLVFGSIPSCAVSMAIAEGPSTGMYVSIIAGVVGFVLFIAGRLKD